MVTSHRDVRTGCRRIARIRRDDCLGSTILGMMRIDLEILVRSSLLGCIVGHVSCSVVGSTAPMIVDRAELQGTQRCCAPFIGVVQIEWHQIGKEELRGYVTPLLAPGPGRQRRRAPRPLTRRPGGRSPRPRVGRGGSRDGAGAGVCG
jgi:hypothetical protein